MEKKKRNKETCPGQVLYLQEICTCVFMLGKNTSSCVYHICHLHYTIINILNNYFYLEFQILISLYLFITHTYICIYICMFICVHVCIYRPKVGMYYRLQVDFRCIPQSSSILLFERRSFAKSV